MNPARIFEQNEHWIKRRLGSDPGYLDRLSRPQQPGILYIGCADSRVMPEAFMGAGPGEVFVHRNVGNLVSSLDPNTGSAVIYGVEHLKVGHVVVCGHYDCGAVKAVLQSDDLGSLEPWLRNLRAVSRRHQAELEAVPDATDRCDRLVEHSVRAQCANILEFPEVQASISETGLQVHGWVFDLRSGRIVDLNVDRG
ncbi:MAG: carbonic anhydrase [Gemmatimonadetes bacterium]|nr:carbonic anhydrase [Gemmatimonadota bacterium]MYG85295.1 carbonic anhydrase [Gemmatimonadota bacterium]MYJ88962.1 carbonic anhydrase [Gemmatimonadota bacterium]